MSAVLSIGTIAIKILKLVLNFICIILYRTGFQGSFLGVGGTWNLNEEKNADAEIVASGVFVGFIVYTAVALISMCFASDAHKHTFTDTLMNIIGTFLWVAVGATALHYWHGYLAEHKYSHVNSERQVGLALGALCVMNGAAFLLDSVISVIFLIQNNM